MIGCQSITRSSGYYVTTNTPPDGDDTGNIATTQFVQTAINNIPVVTGYALLDTTSSQTFTGPIAFTSATIPQINSVNIATVAQITVLTNLTIAAYSASNSSIVSGFNQLSMLTGSIVSFVSAPFQFNIVATPITGVPAVTVQFNIKPWSSYPPTTLSGKITCFCNNNSTNYTFSYTWSSGGAAPYLIYLYAPSGAPVTQGNTPAYNYLVNLASLGSFAS
jgi:hypothetical protein